MRYGDQEESGDGTVRTQIKIGKMMMKCKVEKDDVATWIKAIGSNFRDLGA